jgi:lipopolysaccharide export system protein LptA
VQKSPICRRVVLEATLLLTVFCLPAHAERADREKPVNIEADKMTADDNKKSTHFEGRVILTQGTIRLTADDMTVREDADGFKFATAYGNPVTFRQKREGVNEWVDGMAQHVEYNGKLDRIELFDKALVRRDKDEIRGNYLSYDTKTEFLQARGAGATDGGQASPNGRVHVTLQPKNDKTKPAPAPSPQLKRDPEVAP